MTTDFVKVKQGERLKDGWAASKLIDWAAGKRGNEQTKEAMRGELDELATAIAGPAQPRSRGTRRHRRNLLVRLPSA